MDQILERLEHLEIKYDMFNEENNANKFAVKVLQKKLLDSDKKIKELTDQRQTSSFENAGEVQIEKRFRHIERKMIKLEHQQQQQIEDVNVKLEKVDKLQILFYSAILKKANDIDKIERMNSRMNSISSELDSVNSKMDSVSSRMNSFNSRMDSVSSKMDSVNSRMDSVSSKMDSVSSRMNSVNSKMDSVSSKMNSVNSRMDSVSSKMDSVNSRMDSVNSKMDSVSSRMNSVNSRMDSVSSKIDSVSGAVDDLKSSRPKTKDEEETQQAQASAAATPMKSKVLKWFWTNTKERQQAQASSAATPVKTQDYPLEMKFKSCMTRVKDRNIPLFLAEYGQLCALESIAGIPNGPAFQFETNRCDGNSQRAEFWRLGHIKEFHTKGINTTQEAMEEFVKLCDQQTCETAMADTKYYSVYNGYGNLILAIDLGGLRYLDPDTKKEFRSWRWDEVTHCEIDGLWIVLTFTNGDKEEFDTHEYISPQVHATIHSFMRK